MGTPPAHDRVRRALVDPGAQWVVAERESRIVGLVCFLIDLEQRLAKIAGLYQLPEGGDTSVTRELLSF